MTWVKLEDDFSDHRKILAAGPKGVCLWVCGLAYANRRPEHDGFIPEAKVLTLYPMPAARRVADRLVMVGLWEAIPGGYRIHDYHDYQPTAEEVERVSQARRAAGQVGGRRSGEARRSKHEATVKQGASQERSKPEANEEANEEAKTNPVPVPVPVPELLPNGPVPQDGPLRGGSRRPRRSPPGGGVTVAVWEAYAAAYADRYGTSPVRNRRVNGQLAALVDRLGATDAPVVAAWYVGHGGLPYVRAKHAVGLLLAHCEGLHTEWVTGRVITETQARQADRTATNRETLAVLLADREAREKPP